MAKILLEMKNITKTFPGVKALDNVNLQVEEGEIHALVGENTSPEDTSTPLHTGTMLLAVQEIPVQVKEAILPEHPKAIPHKMTSPVTWRKSSAEVTSARKPLKADWVSVTLTEMNKQRSNVGIPLPRSVRPKRSTIAPNSSSSPVIPMRRSSTLLLHPMM